MGLDGRCVGPRGRCWSRIPGIRWVQLPWAGIEPFVEVLDDTHAWTCGKGVYAVPVAEHALMLALAGLRGLGTYARAASWSGPRGDNLVGRRGDDPRAVAASPRSCSRCWPPSAAG